MLLSSKTVCFGKATQQAKKCKIQEPTYVHMYMAAPKLNDGGSRSFPRCLMSLAKVSTANIKDRTCRQLGENIHDQMESLKGSFISEAYGQHCKIINEE